MIDFFLADIEQIILPKINNFNLTVLSITFFVFTSKENRNGKAN